MSDSMSALEIVKIMVYPDPRMLKILSNPSLKEKMEEYVENDLGADIENLLKETYNQYGGYEDVPNNEREDYMSMVLGLICTQLDLDSIDIMSSDVLPMQSKDIKLPELGVSAEPEVEEQPNISNDEENLYNSEGSEVGEGLEEGPEYTDEEYNNPDDDDEDSMPPFGDDEDQMREDFEEMGGMSSFEDLDEENNGDGYIEPGDSENPDWEDDNVEEDNDSTDEATTQPEPLVQIEEPKPVPVPTPKAPAPSPKAEVKPTEVKPVETKPEPKLAPKAVQSFKSSAPQGERVIEKIIIHNAPKREFRLYEETEEFLREIDEDSVKDQDDIDINLLWNMLNDMYIWRRRVEKKVLNIESRLPQVGTLDIGKMYKVFPDHIEIYKSSRLIKSITNRFVDFDQDTLATGLVNSTVQYNGKIWGVGISENINISGDYAIYNFATNPETMEKVLREFIKGL